MSDLNTITLLGRLCAEPELSYTPSGIAICKGRLAVNSPYTDKTGTKKEEVLYINFDVWKKQGESLAEYMHKGNRILIVGRLMLNQWTDKEDKPHKDYRVTVNRLIFIDLKPKGNGQPAPLTGDANNSGSAARIPESVPPGADEQDEKPISDEDLPF